MVAGESFLDSAQQRASIVSHAKELNYVPRSTTSATAMIAMTWSGNSGVYTIEKGREFSAVANGTALIFTTDDQYTVSSSNGFFSVNLTLREGPYLADAFVMATQDPPQRFILTNPSIDVASISVAVTEDSSATPVVYSRALTTLGLDETSRVWFLQAAGADQYEIVFGDGVLGFRPGDGARVIVDYRVSKGTGGNTARSFSPTFNPTPGDATNIQVTTLSSAAGGLDPETDESIKFYAPRYFRVQERAVTADDYALLLRQAFPEVRDVLAYGGEDATPPSFGRVFVVVDASDTDFTPQSRKDAYAAFLSTRCGLTSIPVILDPVRTYAAVDSVVAFDPSISPATASGIVGQATSAIQAYAAAHLGTFSSVLRMSRLVAAIDESDPAIVSNMTTLRVYAKLRPITGTKNTITVQLGVPLQVTQTDPNASPTRLLEAYTVWTSAFRYNGFSTFAADDGLGKLRLVSDSAGRLSYSAEVGTVDYETGTVTLSGFAPDSFEGNFLRVYGRPAVFDVRAPRGGVLALGDEGVVTSRLTR